MKAILLAAGYGTRLKPITNTIPKCLVLINGRPLLEHWIIKLLNIGITEIIINTHHLSSIVLQFINNSPYRRYIRVSHEEKLLGTAGTLLNNLHILNNEETLLIHADNYCLDDLQGLLNAHRNRPVLCLMTMMLFETSDPKSCGIVELDKNGVVIKFHEKIDSPPGNVGNAAIYVLSDKLLSNLYSVLDKTVNFSEEVIPLYLGKIYTYKTIKFFIDIGTQDNLNIANNI